MYCWAQRNLSEWSQFKSGWQIRGTKGMIVSNSGRNETPRPGYKIRRDPISYQNTYKRNGHIICKCLIVYTSLGRHYISAYNFLSFNQQICWYAYAFDYQWKTVYQFQWMQPPFLSAQTFGDEQCSGSIFLTHMNIFGTKKLYPFHNDKQVVLNLISM